jgi:hypothetical protein
MIPTLVHLYCGPSCKLPYISQKTLSQIERSKLTAPDHPFIDFVCETCGKGKRHFVKDLQPRDAVSIPAGRAVVDLPLLRTELKCSPTCESPAIVYAIAESKKRDAGPLQPFHKWTLEGITCGEGNIVVTPTLPIRSEVYNPL